MTHLKIGPSIFSGVPSYLSFDLYCIDCLDILFVSILSMYCSHFCWYCCISRTMFYTSADWVLSQSNLVIPYRSLKNLIYDTSSLCSSLFFSTQDALPNFKAPLAVILSILNFVYLVICFRNAAQTIAVGGRRRQMSSALKLGPIS